MKSQAQDISACVRIMGVRCKSQRKRGMDINCRASSAVVGWKRSCFRSADMLSRKPSLSLMPATASPAKSGRKNSCSIWRTTAEREGKSSTRAMTSAESPCSKKRWRTAAFSGWRCLRSKMMCVKVCSTCWMRAAHSWTSPSTKETSGVGESET